VNIHLLKKYIGIFLSINLKRQLTGPLEVELNLTSKCDINCLSCFPILNRPDLDFGLIPGLFDSFDGLSVCRVILAGDKNCLLYPKISQLIGLAKKHRFRLGIILNNLSLTKRNLGLLEGFDFIYVSLLSCIKSSFGAVHPGMNYSRFGESVKVMKVLKKKIARINVVLFEQNYREIIDLLRFAKDLSLPIYFNLAVTKHKPQIEIRDKANLKRQINRGAVYAKKQGLCTNLGTIGRIVAEKPHIPCYLGYWQASISLTGDVFFCCRNRVVLGNIKKNSFENIWFSTKYSRLRNQRFKEDITSCDECLFKHLNLRLSQYDLHSKFDY